MKSTKMAYIFVYEAAEAFAQQAYSAHAVEVARILYAPKQVDESDQDSTALITCYIPCVKYQTQYSYT